MMEGYIDKWDDAYVACNGCQLCCKKSFILVLPDRGDDPSQYLTKEYEGFTVLQHKENGDCIYLNEHGCSIHGHAPIICRVYSCVAQYRSMSRKERKQAIAEGLLAKDIVNAARARLGEPSVSEPPRTKTYQLDIRHAVRQR